MAKGRKTGGRKKGSANVKTRELADQAASEGITPLEVMLNIMRKRYDAGAHDQAAQVARDAAPYMHPRLQATEHSGPGKGPIQLGVSFVMEFHHDDDA